MSNHIPLRLIDRSRTVADWKCPRSRYWNYEYKGRGLAKESTSLPLFTGITVHDALASIASLHSRGFDVDIDGIADAANAQMKENLLVGYKGVVESGADEFAKEQGALTEGLIRGFYAHVWPRLMVDYKIVAVETEMEYELAPGYIFMAKPDLVVEDSEGNLIYIEYKTTSSKKPEWVNSWETAVQLHSSVKATEATLGRPVSSVQIVGLYKGYESYGKQSSPFCYAYKRSGNPPFTEDQVQYEYKAGFKRYATWELPGGVKAWVDGMPENVLANQFPMTAPIFVNDDLVEAFFKQRAYREANIVVAMRGLSEDSEDADHYLNSYFPQHFDQCVPSFGWSCQFKKLCHGQVADPLTEGYVLRTPHHAKEVFDESVP